MRQGKIALEEHFLSAHFAQRATNVSSELYADIERRLYDFDDLRIADMDACGIERAILSLNMPGIQAVADARLARDRARQVNDALAGVIKRRPDRYGGFAALPLQDPDAAAAELFRCITELGFVGAMVNGYSNVAGPDTPAVYLDDERYEPFWTVVETLDIPVYLHPRNPLPQVTALFAGRPELAGAVWGFTVETATHALRLITSGLFDRHPDLTVILGHLGEGLPALIRRIEMTFAASPMAGRLRSGLAYYFRQNFALTTSANFSTPALMAAILEVGTDRILFSVDYPWASMSAASGWFDSLQLSDSDLEKIGRANAQRLLKLV